MDGCVSICCCIVVLNFKLTVEFSLETVAFDIMRKLLMSQENEDTLA